MGAELAGRLAWRSHHAAFGRSSQIIEGTSYGRLAATRRHADADLDKLTCSIDTFPMRIFLAGASGAIGRRLVPLLLRAGHAVTGTTRSNERANQLQLAGAVPSVVNVYDVRALGDAVRAARPEVVIHQLTDLPSELDDAKMAASYESNARIRVEGTRNLLVAAAAASVRRFIVQSIAFAYAPGGEPHTETDPLDFGDSRRALTVRGVADMEGQALRAHLDAIVLRYGLLYGPGTWYETANRKPALHVDAAAHAALLALTRGAPGIYNITEDDGAVSIRKARDQLGFDPQFRSERRAADPSVTSVIN